MIKAELFKDERGLGNPLTPADRLKKFINRTSVDVINIVVTSTKTLKPSSREEWALADEILLIYREEEDGLEKRVLPGSGQGDS